MIRSPIPALLGFLIAWAGPALASTDTLDVTLDGFQVQPTVITPGRAEFTAQIDRNFEIITYTLTYDELRGGITQASLKIGRAGVNGGTAVILCTNHNNGPRGTPVCPAAPNTISGSIEWFNVLDLRGQGILQGEIDKVLQAIDAGAAYVVIHTGLYPSGEIRGQITAGP